MIQTEKLTSGESPPNPKKRNLFQNRLLVLMDIGGRKKALLFKIRIYHSAGFIELFFRLEKIQNFLVRDSFQIQSSEPEPHFKRSRCTVFLFAKKLYPKKKTFFKRCKEGEATGKV